MQAISNLSNILSIKQNTLKVKELYYSTLTRLRILRNDSNVMIMIVYSVSVRKLITGCS